MEILLVEPGKSLQPTSINKLDDEKLLYPPLSLMKLSTYHKSRGDNVTFVRGIDRNVFIDLFNEKPIWDRVYITTIFTYNFKNIVKAINFYKDVVGGTASKIFVGGIAASLLPDKIFEETGIYPVTGLLYTAEKIKLDDKENIDLLEPDYSMLDSNIYAINDTYYSYTTKGCVNKCPWCAVPILEPKYTPYIDIKPIIESLRSKYGDKAKLKLMDNNILASPNIERIVDDLLRLGYGRGDYTNTKVKKKRVIDFNQGLDASFLDKKNMKLLAKLYIKPMRIAFDRIKEKEVYLNAIKLASKYEVKNFSNYMLYNFRDTPRNLFDRIMINISLNEKWQSDNNGKIYSYPMRYAPIDKINNRNEMKFDTIENNNKICLEDWYKNPFWTSRFIRNIEIMKGVAHGAISPTPTLARRTIGETFEEFIANLYMPEEFLRNRNKHEKRIYKTSTNSGTGLIEEFRDFIYKLFREKTKRYIIFHNAVSRNKAKDVKNSIDHCDDEEIKKWLNHYLKQ